MVQKEDLVSLRVEYRFSKCYNEGAEIIGTF